MAAGMTGTVCWVGAWTTELTRQIAVQWEHLAYLRRRIAPLDTDSRRRQYLAGAYPRAELVTDVDRRYRWDLYFASRAGLDADLPYTDNQLDTALRAPCRRYPPPPPTMATSSRGAAGRRRPDCGN
jgi:hypothetical protein